MSGVVVLLAAPVLLPAPESVELLESLGEEVITSALIRNRTLTGEWSRLLEEASRERHRGPVILYTSGRVIRVLTYIALEFVV